MAITKVGPLLVIVGETASGKSSLALRLAERFDGEIICADSWTVRREVDVGTAKPTLEERQRITHHLLDIVGPNEDFTAAVFKHMAQQAIDDIIARDKLPILVGGTGLYIDGVIYDFSFLPAGNRQDRLALNDLDISQLLKKISDLNINLGDVDVRNKRRLIRLIESNGAMPVKHSLRERTLILGLKVERNRLKRYITERVDRMLDNGLEAEVSRLIELYGWDCEALKGVGYAQWRDYFDGLETRDYVRQKIIKATLDLAKRQRTWFQRNKSIQWYNTPVNWQEVVDSVTTFLNNDIP